MADRERFEPVVIARAASWRRTAFLVCGNWSAADDVLQQTLLRLYVRWSRVDEQTVDAYARKILVRIAIDEARRPHRRWEAGGVAMVDRATAEPDPDDALTVQAALSRVPARQRAAMALRYYQGLSVAETAASLGVTQGTVKSQTARGLRALRRELGPDYPSWPTDSGTTPTTATATAEDQA